MWTVVVACTSAPVGPSARERFVAEPPQATPEGALLRVGGTPWGPRLERPPEQAGELRGGTPGAGGRGVGRAAIGSSPPAPAEGRPARPRPRPTPGPVLALEGGRFAVRTDGRWSLWDPARGHLAGASSKEGERPTPDGAWVVGPEGARRLDPTPPGRSRVEHVDGLGVVAWGPDTAVVLDRAGPPGLAPDGELVVVLAAPADPARASPAGVRLERPATGRAVAFLPGCLEPADVTWSADGSRLVCEIPDGLAVYGRDGAAIGTRAMPRGRVAISAGGAVVVSAGPSGSVVVWHVDDERTWTAELAPGTAAVPSDDGSLVFASDGKGVAVFDAADGARLDPARDTRAVDAAAIGPDGEIAAATGDLLRAWDADGRHVLEASVPFGVATVVWTADALCASGGGRWACFDPRVGPEPVAASAPPPQVSTRGGSFAGFDGSASLVAVGLRVVRVGVDAVDVDGIPHALPAPGRRAPALSIASDGRAIRVAHGREADVLDLVAGTWGPDAAGDWVDALRDAAVTRAGLRAEAQADGSVLVTRAEVARPPRAPTAAAPVADATFRVLAPPDPVDWAAATGPAAPPRSGSGEGNVWFERGDGEYVQIAVPGLQAWTVRSDRIAIASTQVGVFLVDRVPGTLGAALLGPTDLSRPTLAWSPDGGQVALHTAAGPYVWTADGAEVSRPREPVRALAISPDGATAAVVADDRLALVDLADGRLRWSEGVLQRDATLRFAEDGVQVLGGFRGGVARFDPDGRMIGSTLTPWRGGGGLVVRDDGSAEVRWGDAFTVRPDGTVTPAGPAPGGPAWRLAFTGAIWAHPGLAHTVPDGRPACAGGDGFSCSTVPAAAGERASVDGLERLHPSPTGEWVLGRTDKAWVLRGPDGASRRLAAKGTEVAAWASATRVVVAGAGRLVVWEVGEDPDERQTRGGAGAVAAAGERVARGVGEVVLVGRDDGSVDCVLPGSADVLALSPSGGTVAWLDDAGGLWRAEVDSCRILQRPPDVHSTLQWPAWLTGLHPEVRTGEWAVVREGRSRVLVAGPRAERVAEVPVPDRARDLAVGADGVVAWRDGAGLAWWSPATGVRAVDVDARERVVAFQIHPTGALVLATPWDVVVVARETLERSP